MKAKGKIKAGKYHTFFMRKPESEEQMNSNQRSGRNAWQNTKENSFPIPKENKWQLKQLIFKGI